MSNRYALGLMNCDLPSVSAKDTYPRCNDPAIEALYHIPMAGFITAGPIAFITFPCLTLEPNGLIGRYCIYGIGCFPCEIIVFCDHFYFLPGTRLE